MRFALESPKTQELLPDSKGQPLAYFFQLRGKALVQKSLRGMLEEILCQLLQQFPHFYTFIQPLQKSSQNFCVGTSSVKNVCALALSLMQLVGTDTGRACRRP
jgi:hypothetical protein